MKRTYTKISILLSFFLLAGWIDLQAQIEISPSPVEVSVHPAAIEGVAYSFVINNGATGDFVWERNVIAISDGWDSAVCDKEMCHNFQVSSMEITLEAGESGTLDVHAYPNGIPGSAIIEVSVTSLDDATITASGTYYFNQSVSVPEQLTQAVTLYPNPAVDQVFIQEAKDVERIEVFSLTGRQVLDVTIGNSNAIDVSSLSTGTYVTRLYNKSNQQVSSNILIKK